MFPPAFHKRLSVHTRKASTGEPHDDPLEPGQQYIPPNEQKRRKLPGSLDHRTQSRNVQRGVLCQARVYMTGTCDMGLTDLSQFFSQITAYDDDAGESKGACLKRVHF